MFRSYDRIVLVTFLSDHKDRSIIPKAAGAGLYKMVRDTGFEPVTRTACLCDTFSLGKFCSAALIFIGVVMTLL